MKKRINISPEEKEFLNAATGREDTLEEADLDEYSEAIKDAATDLVRIDEILRDELESANLSERGRIEELYCAKIDLLYYLARGFDPLSTDGLAMLREAKKARQEYEQMVAPLLSRVTKKNMEVFAPFLTQDLKEEIEIGKCDAMGAIRGGGDGAYSAGVIVYYIDEDPITPGRVVVRIKWLYVADEYRKAGVANFLIGSLMSQITDLFISAVTVDIPVSNSYSEVLGHIFDRWNFAFVTGTTPEFVAEIDYIEGIDELEKLSKGADSFGRSGIDNIILQRYLKKSSYGGYLRSAVLPEGYFDPDLSVHLGEWNRADGMLLAHVAPSGMIVVELLDAAGDDTDKLKCLISAFLMKALEKCGPGTKIMLPVDSFELGEFVDRICPDSLGDYLIEGILSV